MIMSDETLQQQVTIPGLPTAQNAKSGMLVPVADGSGDYALSVEQLGEYMRQTLVPITEAERQKLSGLQNVPADWTGTQEDYNALGAWDAGRWYLIVENDGAIVALWRGAVLVWAEPNCVGQFSADSVPADWKWWPDGVETSLPVDPATKRFAFYWPQPLTKTAGLFTGGVTDGSVVNRTLIRIEKLPHVKDWGSAFYYLPGCEVYPVIDCRHIEILYGVYKNVQYMLSNSSKIPKDLYFRNTELNTGYEMAINNSSTEGQEIGMRVWGLDFSSTNAIQSWAFGNYTALIQGVNLGKCKELSTADFRSEHWGNDGMAAGARQSVVDTLLTHSFDRVAAGYDPVTIKLTAYTYGVLTADEIAAITAKGYTLTQS